MSSTEVTPIDPNTDPYGWMGLIKNLDGSVARIPEYLPTFATSFHPENPIPGLSKDVPINQENKTWARIYLPRQPESSAAPATKLPLVIYYHGGGFVVGSAATSMFQKFCYEIAAEIQAMVVSVDYRLAPEHRLPAAYDDCAETLRWITTSGDEWLTNHADFSKCFLMGSSAGGNIAYHVGLRAAVDRLTPLKIQGVILHQPFFGGTERTPSEIRSIGDKGFPPCLTDAMWDVSLPIGADRDHEYCNAMRAVRSDLLGKMRDEGWRFLVTGCDGDLFVDRQIEFVRMLRDEGVCVVDKFSDGGFHGVEHFDDSRAKIFYGILKGFVISS